MSSAWRRAALAAAAAVIGCSRAAPTGSNPPGDTAATGGPDTTTLNRPDTITVSGQVVDGALQPLGAVPVVIAGHDPVSTDASGHFTVSGVQKPYNAVTVLSSLRLGVRYAGLTRPDPVLMISVTNLVTPQTVYGNISGKVSGGTGDPATSPVQTAVWFESPRATYSVGADPYTGAYQMGVSWRGATSTTGTIHALQIQYSTTTPLPTAYTGYGTRTGVVVSSGGSVTGQDVQLSAVDTIRVNGAVTLPSGYTINSKTLRTGFGAAPMAPPVFPFLTDRSAASEFSYVAPMIPGTAITLSVGTLGGAGSGAATVTSANAGGLSVVLPERPQAIAPADSATGVAAGASVAWHPINGAIYMVVIYQPNASNGIRLNLWTADTTVAIPDLSALGLGLAPATTYGWAVYAVAPFASVDQSAGNLSFFLPDNYTSGYSVERRFTTPP